MLHRIEVDVIDVTLEVSVVADCMLPKPSLPDSRFAPLYLAPRSQLRRRQLAGKSAFDLPPAGGKIGIAWRQCPNGVEMVRQDADGVRFKRPARLDRTINLPQAGDALDQQIAGAVSKHDREKEHPAADSRAPISRHGRIMARAANRVRKIAQTPCQMAAPRRAILPTRSRRSRNQTGLS